MVNILLKQAYLSLLLGFRPITHSVQNERLPLSKLLFIKNKL